MEIKVSDNICSESICTRFAPTFMYTLLGRVSTKVVKRIVKFEILDLGQIFLFIFFLTL